MLKHPYFIPTYRTNHQPDKKGKKPNILYPREEYPARILFSTIRAKRGMIFKYEKWHNDTQDERETERTDGSPQYK